MGEGKERACSVTPDESRRRPWVITVAAVSGGGKTTIAKGLARRLGAYLLSFDDYDFEGPDDFVAWIDHGADYRDWDLSPLVVDLQQALTGPYRYVILDYPFAYAQYQVSPYIDVAIYVDTPLDVALSRRLLRDFSGCVGDAILRDVKHYVERGRRGYLEQLKTVRPLSDIVTDGTESTEVVITDIVSQLASRLTIS